MGRVLELGKEEKLNLEGKRLFHSTEQTSGERLPWEAAELFVFCGQTLVLPLRSTRPGGDMADLLWTWTSQDLGLSSAQSVQNHHHF